MKKILLGIVLITFFSCGKDRKTAEDPELARVADLYVENSTGKNLIGFGANQYHPDSIKIYDLNTNQEVGAVKKDTLSNYFIRCIYIYILGFPESLISTLDADAKIGIKLNAVDTDTLNFRKKVNEDFIVRFNNKIIDTIPATKKFEIIHLKK